MSHAARAEDSTIDWQRWQTTIMLGVAKAPDLAALTACEGHTGLVHIHDGARPLVTAEAIRKVRDKAKEMGGAILAGRAADTVKIAKEHTTSPIATVLGIVSLVADRLQVAVGSSVILTVTATAAEVPMAACGRTLHQIR